LVKGLSTQGPYNLELEGVYVQLNVDPTTTHGASPNPLQTLPENLRSGSHTIWQYITDKNTKGQPGQGQCPKDRRGAAGGGGRSSHFLLTRFFILPKHYFIQDANIIRNNNLEFC